MRFSIIVKDSKFIKSMFRDKTEFLDVFVTEEVIVFFTDFTTVFSYCMFKLVDYDEKEINLNFRIPREGFLSLLCDGVLSFSEFENIIYVRFTNNDIPYTMQFPIQTCNLQGLADKLDLLEEASEFPRISLDDLRLLGRLSRNSNLPITVDNGVAYISVGELLIFSKTECTDLSVYPNNLNQLLSQPSHCDVYNVRNYIISCTDNYGIVVRKALSVLPNDYEFIKSQKRIDVIDIDLTPANSLLSWIKKYDTAVLDLLSKALVLKQDSTSYSAPITATSASSSDNLLFSSLPDISFPEIIFKQILSVAKSNQIKVSLTKKLVRIRITENTLLVFRRR